MHNLHSFSPLLKSSLTLLGSNPFFLSPFKKQNATNKRVKEKEPKGKVTLQVQKEERKAVTQSKMKMKKRSRSNSRTQRQVTRRRLDKQVDTLNSKSQDEPKANPNAQDNNQVECLLTCLSRHVLDMLGPFFFKHPCKEVCD
jgi:hypothetical protein